MNEKDCLSISKVCYEAKTFTLITEVVWWCHFSFSVFSEVRLKLDLDWNSNVQDGRQLKKDWNH